MPEIVVIGSGIAGASAAYRLAQAGARVALVDRADPGGATAAGAGIIAPGTSLRPLPAFYPLGRRAAAFYPDLLARLAEDGETATGYAVPGALHLAWDDAEAARLPETLARFRERAAAGYPNLGAVEELAPAEARRRFPPLAEPRGALWVPGAARVDGRLLRDALHRAATRRGADLVAGDAVPETAGGRVTGVRVEAGGSTRRLPADALIVAGGAWSGPLGAALGARLPVEPQRGQIAHLALPGAATGDWPILVGYGGHYLLTFPPDRIVAGATRETGSGFDPRLTAAGVHEVLGVALRVAPGLAGATLAEVRVGLRPASPDGLPLLGPAPGAAGAWLAAGFGPSGLQLGPFGGALAADLALGRPAPPGLDLAPFAPDRFAAQDFSSRA